MMGGCVWGGGTTRQRSGQSSPKTSWTSSARGGSKRKNKKIFKNRVSFTEGKEEPLVRSRPPQQERGQCKQEYLFLRVGFILKIKENLMLTFLGNRNSDKKIISNERKLRKYGTAKEKRLLRIK
jgi:hypothetical protein